jgi:hypothetical protein
MHSTTKVQSVTDLAERAIAPDSPSSYGICSIINSLAIDSIANPHLNSDPGAIITFLDEAFGLIVFSYIGAVPLIPTAVKRR